MSKHLKETTRVPSKIYPMPFVRVELVPMTIHNKALHVLISKRQEEPSQGLWALPGGVLRIDLDESIEAAAQRVARERLGRWLENLSQVTAVGGPNRDPRAPWALSVVYRCMVPADIETTPGKRVQELSWYPVAKLAGDCTLAFDHDSLIEESLMALRTDIKNFKFQKGCLPTEFTLPELQTYAEVILGSRLDKVTFRRRVETSGILKAISGATKGGAHRPAQIYQLV